jgi:hypothetical protein
VPPLRVYALKGPSTVAAWVHNRQYNIMDVVDPDNLPSGLPISNAKIYFTDMPTDGPNGTSTWRVEWWTDTKNVTANPSCTYTVMAQDGILCLEQGTNMPSSITWDAALILTRTQ